MIISICTIHTNTLSKTFLIFLWLYSCYTNQMKMDEKYQLIENLALSWRLWAVLSIEENIYIYRSLHRSKEDGWKVPIWLKSGITLEIVARFVFWISFKKTYQSYLVSFYASLSIPCTILLNDHIAINTVYYTFEYSKN